MSDTRPEYQSGVGIINGTQFHWGSGSPGRYWSIPYGDYPVTPDAPTGAWAHSVGAIPINNNIIPDPVLHRNRVGIMIHPSSSNSLDHLYTQGCFAVAPQEWPAVRQQILDEAQKGPLYLHVQPGQAAAFTHTPTLSAAGAPPADQSPPGTTVNTTSPPHTPTPIPGGNDHATFIQNYAKQIGLDPNLALGIANAEGLRAWSASNPNAASTVDVEGGKPFSFGDFQLNIHPGAMGAKAIAAGIDPTDPKQWQAADKFALDQMKAGGVGPWKGDPVAKAYLASGQIPAAPATPGTTTAPAPATPTPSVGNAIASLTQQAGDSDLAKTMTQQPKPQGGVGPDQGQAMQMQQMASMGNPRQQLIQMQAQQLAAQLQQRAQQPLSWGTAPYGAGAGLQPSMPMAGQLPPGVTLNSMGGQGYV